MMKKNKIDISYVITARNLLTGQREMISKAMPKKDAVRLRNEIRKGYLKGYHGTHRNFAVAKYPYTPK